MVQEVCWHHLLLLSGGVLKGIPSLFLAGGRLCLKTSLMRGREKSLLLSQMSPLTLRRQIETTGIISTRHLRTGGYICLPRKLTHAVYRTYRPGKCTISTPPGVTKKTIWRFVSVARKDNGSIFTTVKTPVFHQTCAAHSFRTQDLSSFSANELEVRNVA